MIITFHTIHPQTAVVINNDREHRRNRSKAHETVRAASHSSGGRGTWTPACLRAQNEPVSDQEIIAAPYRSYLYSVKVTGLAQKLGQLGAVHRDLQSKSWANLQLLGQACNFYAMGGPRSASASRRSTARPTSPSRTPLAIRTPRNCCWAHETFYYGKSL